MVHQANEPTPHIKDGTKGTFLAHLRDSPPLEVSATLYLDGRLALHHEIDKDKVLNTRTLVISHVRTGNRIFNIYDGKAVALKVVAELSQAGDAWDFGEFGVVCSYREMSPEIKAAMDAAMVVMHGEGWDTKVTRRKQERQEIEDAAKAAARKGGRL
jgi:hypothetical protein